MKLLVGWFRYPVLGLLVMSLGLPLTSTPSGHAQTPKVLRVGLAEDPDILDPTLARTFVGRIVFASLCDKLYDIDSNLHIVPQLAVSLPQRSADGKTLTIPLRQGVKFHDGTEFNAEAAKFSLERHANLPGSQRKSDIASLNTVEIVDPFTIRLTLHHPFAPFLAQLTDRAGMMVSPKAAKELGDKLGTKPVCAGPYRFVERVAQGRIVGERFADYWDKGNVFVDRVEFIPITDSTARLASLRSGDLTMIERVSPTDLQLDGSDLEGVRGATSLRGAVVSPEQVMPLALGLFAELGIRVDHGDDP